MKFKVITLDEIIKNVLDILAVYPLLFIIDNEEKLVASLSNGDIRRALRNEIDINLPVETIMNRDVRFAYEHDCIEDKISKISTLPEEYAFLPIVGEDLRVLKIVTKNEITRKKNKVILMAGGLGSRLGELTRDIPKPLLHIGNKPILEIIIDEFKVSSFNNFVISVNYKAHMIKDYFRDGNEFDSIITYLHEDKMMGTAGALSLIEQSEIDEPFFVMNGDILTEENFDEILQYHLANKFEATMCVFEHEVTIPYGVIESDEKNRILSIREKPTKRFNVNAGIYVLNPTSLSYIINDEFLDMPTLFQRINDDDKSTGVYVMKTNWIDIGHPDDYYIANQ